MEWTVIAQVLDPALSVVLVACWVLGFILKQTPNVPNWTIIFVLLVFAIIFSILLLGATPLAVLQGILTAAVAAYGYDFVKQLKDRG